MMMVEHRAIRMNLPPGFQSGFGQRLEEVLAVDIIEVKSSRPQPRLIT